MEFRRPLTISFLALATFVTGGSSAQSGDAAASERSEELEDAFSRGDALRQSAQRHAIEAIRTARPLDAVLAIRAAALSGQPLGEFQDALDRLKDPAVQAALISARELAARGDDLQAADLLARVAAVIPDQRLTDEMSSLDLPEPPPPPPAGEDLPSELGLVQRDVADLYRIARENKDSVADLESLLRSVSDEISYMKRNLTDVNRDLDDDFKAEPLVRRVEQDLQEIRRQLDTMRRDIDRLRSDVDRLKYR